MDYISAFVKARETTDLLRQADSLLMRMGIDMKFRSIDDETLSAADEFARVYRKLEKIWQENPHPDLRDTILDPLLKTAETVFPKEVYNQITGEVIYLPERMPRDK